MMNLQVEQKPVITIWYEKGLKAEINANGRIQVVSKGIENFIKFLTTKKEMSIHVGIKDFSVEFDDKIVKFKNYKSLIKYDTFLKFYQGKIINLNALLKQNAQAIEKQRVKSLSTQAQKSKKTNMVPDDYLTPISAALEKRNKEVQKTQKESKKEESRKVKPKLKVNRKKKRNNAVRVTAFIGAVLVAGGVVVSGKKELESNYETPIKNDSVLTDVETLVNEKINFHPEIDIAAVFPETLEEDMQLCYEDKSGCDKVLKTKSNYYSLIQEYARKCGIDPRIVLGIATHESGDHEYGLKAGNKGGLMQIEISFWDGKEIEYYDFDDNESYIIKINKEVIKNVENNILIGCAILQNELRMFNDNILLATLSYNQGYTNTSKILNKTSLETGIPKMDIINNQSCLSWLDYTKASGAGDPNYVSNVLQYTGFGYDIFELVCKKGNGDFAIATTNPIIYETSKTI